MKNLISFCFLASLFFSFTTMNKMVKVTGKVIDQTSQSPLAFATIAFFDTKTNELIIGETTDEFGFFITKVST